MSPSPPFTGGHRASIRRRRSLWILTGSLLVLAVLGITGPSGAAPDCPRPGYTAASGLGQPEDRNGNGVVCVNDDGSFVDDTGAEPAQPDRDANGNGFVCLNSEKNVVTEDREDPDTGGISCPPGFTPVPA